MSAGTAFVTLAAPSEPTSSPPSTMPGDVIQLADEWLRIDTNDASAEAVRSLIREENEDELRSILGSRLKFGKTQGPTFGSSPGICISSASRLLAWPLLAGFPPPPF